MLPVLVLQSLRLERLAVYHDPGSTPWDLEKSWEDMTPEEWEEVCFELDTVSFGPRNGNSISTSKKYNI